MKFSFAWGAVALFNGLIYIVDVISAQKTADIAFLYLCLFSIIIAMLHLILEKLSEK